MYPEVLSSHLFDLRDTFTLHATLVYLEGLGSFPLRLNSILYEQSVLTIDSDGIYIITVHNT